MFSQLIQLLPLSTQTAMQQLRNTFLGYGLGLIIHSLRLRIKQQQQPVKCYVFCFSVVLNVKWDKCWGKGHPLSFSTDALSWLLVRKGLVPSHLWVWDTTGYSSATCQIIRIIVSLGASLRILQSNYSRKKVSENEYSSFLLIITVNNNGGKSWSSDGTCRPGTIVWTSKTSTAKCRKWPAALHQNRGL